MLTACQSGALTAMPPSQTDTRAASQLRQTTESVSRIFQGWSNPYAVGADAAGNVYVTGFFAAKYNSAIYKRTPSGAIREIVRQFDDASSVAADAAGNVYVAFASGVAKVAFHGGITAFGAGWRCPTAVAVDTAQNVYVTDKCAFVHPLLGRLYGALKKVAPDGTITRVGPGFDDPEGVAVDVHGNVFVAETAGRAVVEVAPGGRATKVLSGPYPSGVAVDQAGNAYVAAGSRIEKIAPSGIVTTFGPRFQYLQGIAVDATGGVIVADVYAQAVYRIAQNGQSTAFGIDFPFGVAVDGRGNVYAAVPLNHAVFRIARNGTTTVLTSGLYEPAGLATDTVGDLYVADLSDAIKEIKPDGTVVEIGSGFSNASGVAVDAIGDVYVADTGHFAVKKISRSGTITTILRTGPHRGSVSENSPIAVAANSAGDVYVVIPTSPGSQGNVYVISRTGKVSKFFSASEPHGVAVDEKGNVYITDGAALIVIGGGKPACPLGLGPICERRDSQASLLGGVAVGKDGKLYVADFGSGATIYSIKLEAVHGF